MRDLELSLATGTCKLEQTSLLRRDEMCSLAFVRDVKGLVFYGQTGRGKTHMAIALSIAATSALYAARFFQTAQLMLHLGKAKREGTLDRLLADIAKGEAPHPGRVRLRALRRERCEAALPGDIGKLQEDERDLHH